ncbi:MAG: alcohol dehydrogenase [Phycisphaerales bacterium]|nr:MAG: alcohol dehydrogenase [Phycisphaerales bacterium]
MVPYARSMRALVCTRQSSTVAPVIEYRQDWPDLGPTPAGYARLRTLCSALNHMDLWVGRGIPGVDLSWPRVSGCDACAVVEEVGPGVDASWVGRRVIVNAAVALPQRDRPGDPPASTLAPEYELIGEHHHGMHRQAFHAPVSHLADLGPDDADEVDPIEAAAFGLTALTAWSMMVTKGQLRSGQSVLITGIGGGVATSALQIARHFGCPVVVTSRHQWKLDRARQLGAAFGVLDQGEDWSAQVRQWTGKRGVDMAVDSIGRATHLSCIKSLARGGAYVTPGCTSGPQATTDLARIFWNQLRVLGSTMGTPAEFREVASLFRAGALKPVVDRVYKAQQGQEAYARLEAQDQFGKIVIDWR